MRVLVVEDSETTAEGLLQHLQDRGHKADHAPNGAHGLSYVRSFTYDAVITDYLMPQLSGLDFLRELRRIKKARHLPVVFLTACSAEEYQDLQGQLQRLEPALVLRKPQPFDRVIQVVEELAGEGV